MFKVLYLLTIPLVIFLTIFYERNTKEELIRTGQCCQTCPEGSQKYYSIDEKYDICGECCLKPSNSWFFGIFEKTLKLAENPNPCNSLGYTKEGATVSHGFPFKVPVDYYLKPKSK